MSLFYSEAASIARETPKKQGRQTIALSVDQKRSLSCAQCPLDRAQLIHPKMTPTGADRPDYYFLGESPGKNEDEQGVQFVGDSGQLLRERIPSKYDKRIRWNNSIQCHPPANRDPAPLEIECCRKRIVADIEQTKPKVIVGFGNFPLSWITEASDITITNWRGRRFPVKAGSHTCWFYPITHPAAILRGQHDKKKGKAIVRCFERDLERVFADVEAGLPTPYVEQEKDYLTGVHCLQEYGQAGLAVIEEVLAEYTDIEHSIDIETVGLRPYQTNPLILSIAVGDYDNVLAFPWQHPEARWTPKESVTIKDMVYAYLLGKGKKWAHNCKFEQEWFVHRYGPEVMYETVWADTYGQAHVIDERKGKGLDELTLLYFGFRLKGYWMKRGLNVDAMDRIPLSTYPLSLVLPYNGTDVKYCFALKGQQTARLEELGLTHTYEFMNSTTPSLVMLQRKGVVRNLPAIIQLDKELTAQEEKQYKTIMSQREVMKFSSVHKFSPTSNQDLAAFFKDFLRIPAVKQSNGGGYSVDEEALAQIDHPIAKQILELRSVVKNHGYVTPLLEGGKFVHADGMIHCSYNNYLTVSGRLSADTPNTQNYPRRAHKEVRRVIGCPPGHKFVAFDWGQIEWRTGAMLSRDKNMITELWQGKDIHGDWTDLIGVKFVPKKVRENRKKIRDSIKQYWTFANLYGNTLEAVARDLSLELGVEITPQKLAPFFEQFWSRYPELKQYQDNLMNTYWKMGWVETGVGLRRREPAARNEIINHPLQGTGTGHITAETQSRLARQSYEQDRPSICPMLNVHDDLSFYIPENRLEEDIEYIAREMVICPFKFAEGVPLTVECSIGDNWADKEEVATFSTADFDDIPF